MGEPLHPLLGAELRVKRAGRHLEELHTHLQEWTDLHWNHIDFDKATFLENPEIVTTEPLPREFLAQASVLVGDALNNLRATLDYLVYALAMLGNGGQAVMGTQFPIDEKPEEFKGHIKNYLRHVPPGAILRISKLQPCNGCEWTAKLRDLHNPDKHRHLTSLRSEAQFSATVKRLGPTTLPDGSEGERVSVRPQVVVEVFFADTGENVADVLNVLQREVAAVIDSFKPFIKTGELGVV